MKNNIKFIFDDEELYIKISEPSLMNDGDDMGKQLTKTEALKLANDILSKLGEADGK